MYYSLSTVLTKILLIIGIISLDNKFKKIIITIHIWTHAFKLKSHAHNTSCNHWKPRL